MGPDMRMSGHGNGSAILVRSTRTQASIKPSWKFLGALEVKIFTFEDKPLKSQIFDLFSTGNPHLVGSNVI